MGLLDGGGAALMSAVFSGLYLDAQLYRPDTFADDGKGGGPDGGFGDPEDVKVQPEATTQAMRDTPGYIDTDRRFLMLALGVAEPDTDCEMAFGGKRWSVVNWSKDPASSYYDLHTRLRDNA